MDTETLKKIGIPKTPGVYRFLGRTGKIIYVGKAANLRGRVFSYWRSSADHSPVKRSMLGRIAEVEWTETGSEVEAFLLEANLIKKLKPKYNIALKDDKRYLFIEISTGEEWPRVFVTRKIDRSGIYFGPFVSAEAARETLKAIRKIWPFRSCFRLPKKPCLYYQIGQCPGMCAGKIGRKEYWKIIGEVKSFLSKGRAAVVRGLERRLAVASDPELKGIYARRLAAIEKILANAKILSREEKYAADVVELAKILGLKKIPGRIEGYDVSNIFGRETVGSMVVFSRGEPERNEYRKFRLGGKEDFSESGDTGMLKEMMERRFSRHAGEEVWALPNLIVLDGGRAQLNAAVRILKNNRLSIPAVAVSKGAGLRSARALDKLHFADEKKPLELSLNSPALHLIKRVRDEAHRFAIAYHRRIKRNKLFSRNL